MSKYKPITALYSDLVKVKASVESKVPLNQAALLVQSYAKLHSRGYYSTGHLSNSIMIGFTEEPDMVTAHIGTNVEYALYVEVGTGPKGQASHEGISPQAHPVYRQTPWWIHESQVDNNAASAYGWYYIETDKGKFYKVSGQPARPFLYPAVKNNEKKISDVLTNAYRSEIRRRIK